MFLLSWVGWLGWLRRGGEGTKGGGKDRRKRASLAPLFSAKSWGYSAFQYILPDQAPKTNRCASRFALTASALRASAAEPGRRGVPKLRNFPGKFGRHTGNGGCEMGVRKCALRHPWLLATLLLHRSASSKRRVRVVLTA